MKRYAKFGYAAPFRFRVILEKPQGGGGQNDPPPPGRRLSLGPGPKQGPLIVQLLRLKMFFYIFRDIHIFRYIYSTYIYNLHLKRKMNETHIGTYLPLNF